MTLELRSAVAPAGPTHRPAPEGGAGATTTTTRRRDVQLKGAQHSTSGLIDFGSKLTPLMLGLTSAVNGKGPSWQELRAMVISNLPGDPGSLQQSFMRALQQADKSAASPDDPAYRTALRQLWTCFTLSRVLRGT